MSTNTPPLLPYISRRSTVFGSYGMVSSSQPLATQIGVDILRRGGNAADAAVAVAAALNVTEPQSTGIGGDVSCLFYDAKNCKVTGLNGTGRTPAAMSLDYIRKEAKIEGPSTPRYSIHNVTVPGAAAAWADTVEHFGSGRLSMADILQQAISLAENGFPVSHITARGWKKSEKLLKEMNDPKNNLLIEGARAPSEGEIMYMPDLAKTFKTFAAYGKDGFYKGYVADAIVEAIQSRGGLMTHEDLVSHTASEIITEPISLDYHGITVWELPPNSQGITTLIALGILRALEEEHGLNLSKIEHNSAEYLHIVIEVLRLAFADAAVYVTDPQGPTPSSAEITRKLLSKEYLLERAKLVDLKNRNNSVKRGYPKETSDTVCVSVVDEEGNACSFINSNLLHFGSNVVPNGCGFALHNRGHHFALIDDHPNCIGPSKRPYHTMIPCIITRKNDIGVHELEACFGGGFMQPQGHVQVILNLLHYFANAQHALDLPRICIAPPVKEAYGFPVNVHLFIGDVNSSIVYVEEGIGNDVIKQLESMGHICYQIKSYMRWVFGRGQLIRVVNKNACNGKIAFAGASDPRGDGQAAPPITSFQETLTKNTILNYVTR